MSHGWLDLKLDMHCKVDHNHCLVGFAFAVKAYFKLKFDLSRQTLAWLDSCQAQVMLIDVLWWMIVLFCSYFTVTCPTLLEAVLKVLCTLLFNLSQSFLHIIWQSYWRASLVRKDSREQLLDLRRRMQRSAANVDNGDRLMSRLVFALSELLSDSVSDILHTCATLGDFFLWRMLVIYIFWLLNNFP